MVHALIPETLDYQIILPKPINFIRLSAPPARLSAEPITHNPSQNDSRPVSNDFLAPVRGDRAALRTRQALSNPKPELELSEPASTAADFRRGGGRGGKRGSGNKKGGLGGGRLRYTKYAATARKALPSH